MLFGFLFKSFFILYQAGKNRVIAEAVANEGANSSLTVHLGRKSVKSHVLFKNHFFRKARTIVNQVCEYSGYYVIVWGLEV